MCVRPRAVSCRRAPTRGPVECRRPRCCAVIRVSKRAAVIGILERGRPGFGDPQFRVYQRATGNRLRARNDAENVAIVALSSYSDKKNTPSDFCRRHTRDYPLGTTRRRRRVSGNKSYPALRSRPIDGR